jgi:hypothetical protein
MIHLCKLFEGLCIGLDSQIVLATFSFTVALEPLGFMFSGTALQNRLILGEIVKTAFKVSTSFVPLGNEHHTVFEIPCVSVN